MKRNYFISVLVTMAVGTMVVSCNKEIVPENVKAEPKISILLERDGSYPLTDYSRYGENLVETKADASVGGYLGRSFKLEAYPFDNARNVGPAIIDFEKYTAAHPGNVSSVYLGDDYSYCSTYYGFDRYEEKTDKTRKVGGGFTLNLGLFKIGAKDNYKKIFSSTETQTNTDVFGEYSVKYIGSTFDMGLVTSTYDKEYLKYVDKYFVHNLYYEEPYAINNDYGPFVLTKYSLGAQAFAIYEPSCRENASSSAEEKENDLSLELKATIKKAEVNGNGSLFIGNGSGSSHNSKFSNIRVSLQTKGGLPGYSIPTNAEDINKVNYDLSSWYNSIADPKYHTIVDLPDESLLPLSTFIEEDNLREGYEEYAYHKSGLHPANKRRGMQEPYVIIEDTYYYTDMDTLELETVLITRYSQSVHLQTAKLPVERVNEYVYAETDRVRTMFPGIEVDFCSSFCDVPDMNDYYHVEFKDIKDLEIYSEGRGLYGGPLDLNDATKFIDPESGKIYILSKSKYNGKKVVYTLYNEDVVNDYTLKDVIKRIPENKKVTLSKIRRDYRLEAL